MRWKTTTQYPLEVQFEDIDAGGVVHHPNYLKYLERARCQSMREIGIPLEACLNDGIAFAVAEFQGKYCAPLRLGSKVVVKTRLVAVRKSSLKVLQKIVSADESETPENTIHEFLSPQKSTFFVAQLRLVAIDLKTTKPISIPENIRSAGGIPKLTELTQDETGMDVRLTAFVE